MAYSVLLVDDDLGVLQALMRRMRKETFELRTATSAEEALRILSQASVDLVVSDLHMKGMLGTEFLARVAKEYPSCVRIMLTGQPSMDVVMNAVNNGEVYRFLTKPFDAEKLAQMIREALEQREKASRAISGAQVRSGGNGHSVVPNSAAKDSDSMTTIAAAKQQISAQNETRLSPRTIESLGNPGFLEEQHPKLRIQQYVLETLIGRGAMGIVLKAHDSGLSRSVALKFLSPDWADSTVAHQRFAQEARIAASIRHEHVVTIFAVSEVSGVPFLVMEYVAGESLQQRLDSAAKFKVSDIVRIGIEVALGLGAAHELRLIHRDIKPANILLARGSDRVRITDFGLARAIDHDTNLSQKGMLVGTPQFMAPEQVDGKALSPATDLFSLGSVLYTLCTGASPFASPSLSRLLHAIAEETPTPIRVRNPGIPLWLAQTIEKLHAKNPADRFHSAAAVAECLRREGK